MKLPSAACAAVLGLLALAGVAPAAAEVTRTTEDSFVSRHEVVVEASPKDVWLSLITPAGWWRSDHTWSGDAKNLTLVPQAGGCFCETIPEVDEPGRFTLEGSVEHMRVVQAYPEQALRMIGALGPLQSEPVTGVLTIAISAVPQGTRIVFEYNVGGPMRYEVPVISKAVDGVMGLQIASLAKPLKVVAVPPQPSAPDEEPAAEPAPQPQPQPQAKPGEGGSKSAPANASKPALAPAGGKPAATQPGAKPPAAPAAGKPAGAQVLPDAKAAAPKPVPPVPGTTAAPKAAPKPAPKPPTVEDAFSDLDDPPKQ